MSLPYAERRRKLRSVTQFMCFEAVGDLLFACRNQPLVPGICTSAFCDGISSVARDETAGYCWDCEGETVQSILIFAATH